MGTRGISLIEVLISLGILLAAGIGNSQLFATAVRAMTDARAQTLTVVLASARLEQLRALAFELDADGQRVTDVLTDLSSETPGPGGQGLRGASTDSLAVTTPGFVDYLDDRGQWVGAGAAPPHRAVYVRRWAVEPSADTSDLVTIQVLVRPLALEGTRGADVRRTVAEARLVSRLARVRR